MVVLSQGTTAIIAINHVDLILSAMQRGFLIIIRFARKIDTSVETYTECPIFKRIQFMSGGG